MEINVCKEFYYKVKDDDCFQSIINKFNTSKENVIRNNPEIKLYSGEWIYIKQNNYLTHIVKPAETLANIALYYGVNCEQIKQDNNLINEKLFIGQMLKIYNKKKQSN